MEDFKVISSIDLKTYYNISLRMYFKRRTFIIMFVAFALLQISFITSSSGFNWEDEIWLFGFLVGLYGIIMPIIIYLACKRNIKKIPYLRETLQYTINEDKIELVGDTLSSSTNWQHVSKLIERERFFLLPTSSRGFHYLPKEGFESREAAASFKEMVKGKGIKFSYN